MVLPEFSWLYWGPYNPPNLFRQLGINNFGTTFCVNHELCLPWYTRHVSVDHAGKETAWLSFFYLGIKEEIFCLNQFSLVQSHSHVRLFATPCTAACQASLSITNSQSLLRLMSIESVMPSNHLILCCPLLLLPSTFLSIRVFSNESVLCIRWPKYWSFSFRIGPPNEYSGLVSFRID